MVILLSVLIFSKPRREAPFILLQTNAVSPLLIADSARYVQPTRRCASGHQRPSTKGLQFQVVMALCNAPRDASSSAQPRPRQRGPSGSMGDPSLVGSRTQLHAHWRVSVGQRHTRRAYARLCLMGDPSQNAAPAAFRLGADITARSLQVFKANATLALHPCQTAAAHLPCTRPPDRWALLGSPRALARTDIATAPLLALSSPLAPVSTPWVAVAGRPTMTSRRQVHLSRTSSSLVASRRASI